MNSPIKSQISFPWNPPIVISKIPPFFLTHRLYYNISISCGKCDCIFDQFEIYGCIRLFSSFLNQSITESVFFHWLWHQCINSTFFACLVEVRAFLHQAPFYIIVYVFLLQIPNVFAQSRVASVSFIVCVCFVPTQPLLECIAVSVIYLSITWELGQVSTNYTLLGFDWSVCLRLKKVC